MADSIKEQEQKRMDYVVEKIKNEEETAKKKISRASADTKAIQADFKNNVRIKTGTYSGMMETALTVRQQQMQLEERENSRNQAAHRLEILERMEKKPYFARVDLIEQGEDKKETIYIGLATFSNGPDEFLVYDWRAPISSVYYDGGLGKTTYATPDGEREVDVVLKRQFMVDDGKILTVFDTDETVGDQMLLEVLDESSDVKMKSIVTTIQKEQNKIIRDTKSDLLFVQGAAGSGKTSAVLQRVAYLLYRYRGNLNSGQIILFSPNQLFNDYIDQVLPELGEHNMVQMTYYQYTQHRLPKMHVETLKERFEEDNHGTNKKIRVIKDSLKFFDATTAYSNYLERNGMRFKNIMHNGEIFFSRKEIKSIYYSFNENYHLGNRLEATQEELLKRLSSRVGQEARTDRVQKAVQDLPAQELNALYGDHPRNFVDGDKELLFLCKQYVTKEFMKIKRTIVRKRFLNVNAQYVHFLRHVPSLLDLSKFDVSDDEWQKGVENTIDQIKKRSLPMTDVSCFLYLYDRITGKKGDIRMRYVFIDEIQDYTAYQLAYLKTEFPRAHFTMLGDLNQAIFTKENSHSLLSELSTMFDKDRTNVVQLTKSYRSTRQITDFTKEVLVDGEKVTAFNRNGSLPTMTIDADRERLVEDVKERLLQNDALKLTTAIICKSLSECEWLTEQLNVKGVKATLIRTENQRLVPGTIIVPSYLAKGLEFDAVIMWNANKENYHEEDERQLVYTICSRAMHRLDITVDGEMSPLFDRVPKNLYDIIRK